MVALALVATLFGGCNELTGPASPRTAPQPVRASSASGIPGGADVPLGIGGAYVLNAGGTDVTYRAPSSTGLTLFPGIPVDVTVAGQITRAMTQGYLDFCAMIPGACPPEVKSNEPFGPGGLAAYGLGAATVWWDYYYGYYYRVRPGGTIAYRGPSGRELLAGRTGLYCSWGFVDASGNVTQGDCYTVGGGFTYTVHVSPTPPGQAGLTLAIVNNGLGPSGGPVDLRAASTDGSLVGDIRWTFVSDSRNSAIDPPVAPVAPSTPATIGPLASRSASVAPSANAHFTAGGARVIAINAATHDTTITTDIRTLPAGPYLFLPEAPAGTAVDPLTDVSADSSPAAPLLASGQAARVLISVPGSAAAPVGSADPYTGALPPFITSSAQLDGCDGSYTCSANLNVREGTFVVTGLVRGVRRAAEQRVAAGAGSADRLVVIIEPSTAELLAPEIHMPATLCQALDTESSRRLHVFVVDSAKPGAPKVPRRSVDLSVSAVVPPNVTMPDAGGHVVAQHRGNPKPPGRLGAPQLVTDAAGDGYVQYYASEFGGKYAVVGKSSGATEGADTITVGLSVVPLAAGATYGFIGNDAAHPSNHFGTPTMNANLSALADAFFAKTRATLEFNDISLPLGGRFEVKDNGDAAIAWTNGAHCSHRNGRGADLRTRTFMVGYTASNPSPRVKQLQAIWLQSVTTPAMSNTYLWEGDHLHLKTAR